MRKFNLACVKSRSGHTITVAYRPVLWQSKLQNETAILTIEAEVFALYDSCRELFPAIEMVASQ